MSSPCLGPEFALDAGDRIIADLCGPPNDQDWPFDCSARLNNGLHRNEAGCLWVAPQTSGLAFVQTGSATCALFCGFNTSAAVYGTSIASLTITNTDLCRSQDYFVHTDYNFRITGASTPSVAQFWRQVTGVDGADAGWQLVHTVDYGTTDALRIFTSDTWSITDLAPGASRTIRVGMRVNANVGSGTATNFDARIGVFGRSTD